MQLLEDIQLAFNGCRCAKMSFSDPSNPLAPLTACGECRD